MLGNLKIMVGRGCSAVQCTFHTDSWFCCSYICITDAKGMFAKVHMAVISVSYRSYLQVHNRDGGDLRYEVSI
jgi:hypothetical protein